MCTMEICLWLAAFYDAFGQLYESLVISPLKDKLMEHLWLSSGVCLVLLSMLTPVRESTDSFNVITFTHMKNSNHA